MNAPNFLGSVLRGGGSCQQKKIRNTLQCIVVFHVNKTKQNLQIKYGQFPLCLYLFEHVLVFVQVCTYVSLQILPSWIHVLTSIAAYSASLLLTAYYPLAILVNVLHSGGLCQQNKTKQKTVFARPLASPPL